MPLATGLFGVVMFMFSVLMLTSNPEPSFGPFVWTTLGGAGIVVVSILWAASNRDRKK
jgi:hypothetical protein